MNKLEDMMNDLQQAKEPIGPTREQLEANIKVSHNWITAVSSGTFHGGQSLHIATLIDFLQREHDKAVRDYEAASLKHPEWNNKTSASVQ